MITNLTREHLSEVVKERRRQQRSVDTRERILKAAFDEFAERGFDGASTRSVAARAGVQHPAVTYHFENKDGLWRAVVSTVGFNFSEYFRDQIAEGQSQPDPVERLRAIQEDFVRFAAANPQFHWLMSNVGKRASEQLTWLIEDRLRDYFDGVAKLIVFAQKRGCYVEGDPYHLQYLFIGAVTRLFMLSAEVKQVMGRSPTSKAFLDEHVRACCSLFFRDPPAPRRRAAKAAAKKAETPRRRR